MNISDSGTDKLNAGVRAVIMAGGSGTRLRPLTDTLPKPLVPVAGKPVIFRILELLARHGITEAALTTGYLADKLEAACGEQYSGVRLTYFREEKPLGTAGGVKNTEAFLDGGSDEFIVISGDAACETDLIAALNFHRVNRADATIVTVSVPSPLEYGVISSGEDGRITGFIEKPSPSQAYSDSANTGIYVLSRSVLGLIPPDTARDFGREVFPAMLASGARLYNFADGNYWCDIGDLDAFYACCVRYAELEGKLSRDGNIVGNNCSLGGSTVRRSILFDGVSVSSGAFIEGSILCGSSAVGRGARIAQGCVIGEGCVIGDGASLGPQVRLSAGRSVEAGQRITDGQPVFSSGGADLLSEGGIQIADSACDANLMFRLGDAAAAATAAITAAAPIPGRPVGIMRVGEGTALSRFSGLLAMGAAGRGCDVYDFGVGFRALASFAAERFATPLTLCLEERSDGIFISLYDQTGLCPPRTVERSFIAALAGPTQTREKARRDTRITVINGVTELYRAALAELFEPARDKKPLDGLAVRISPPVGGAAGGTAQSILADLLRSAGAGVALEGEEHPASAEFLRLMPSDDGMSLAAVERSKTYSCELDPWHIAGLILYSELEGAPSGGVLSPESKNASGKIIALPCSAPRILENLASSHGVKPLRYSSQPSDDSEREARFVAGRQRYQFDALFAAAKLCVIAANGGLKAASDKIPHFFLASGDFDTDFAYKTLVMRRFGIPAGDGVCMEYNASGTQADSQTAGGGTTTSPSRVRMIPKRHGGFRIIAEADSMEAAEEMLALSKRRISEIIAETQTR